MNTLAVLAQKGGVGKTTLATCLAVEAERRGLAPCVLDLDPQASASFWRDVRQTDAPAVVSLQVSRLTTTLDAARRSGCRLAVIDGPAIARDAVYSASACANYVLVPTRTAAFDLTSLTDTIGIVRQTGTPFSVVLNFVPPRGVETKEALQLLRARDVDVCNVTVGLRKTFFRAQSKGLAVQEHDPRSSATKEIIDLYEYVLLKMTGDQHEQLP